MSATSTPDDAGSETAITTEQDEEILQKIQQKNTASYAETAKLRYLANNYPGIVFTNDDGFFDVSFEYDREDRENAGKIVRAHIRDYQEERFLAEVNTLRDGYNKKTLGIYGRSEVFEDLEDAEEWMEDQGLDRENLPEYDISEVGGSNE